MAKPCPQTRSFACPDFMNSLKRVLDEEVSPISLGVVRGWMDMYDNEGISVYHCQNSPTPR
jgi:hypothetical protein